MKYFLSALILFSINLITFAQSKAIIGMTIDEVKKIYPDATENKNILSRSENIYGLDIYGVGGGGWSYFFEKGKLTTIRFDKYIGEENTKITSKSFEKCLSATNQLIKGYTEQYGNPDTTIIGNTKFVDPHKKRHWGYDVIEAQWKDYKGMKIKIRFDFFGDKGIYNLIVTINYFNKNDLIN